MGRLWLRLLVSCVIGVAFLAAVAKQVDVIPGDLRVAPWALPAYAATLVAYITFRTGRWWFLIRPLAPVGWARVTQVAMAGAMWTTLLPLRLGELVRPLLLARTTAVGAAPALGALAIERVVDGLFVCTVFFATTAAPGSGESTGLVYQGAQVVMGIFGGALVGLILMARFPRAMGRLMDATVGRVAPVFGRKLAEVAEGVASGLASLPSLSPLLWFLAWTTAYWASNVFGVWVLARGCGLDLDLEQTAAMVAIMSIGLLVPAGPGMLGTFQGAGLVALGVFVSNDVVAARGSVFLFWLYIMQLAALVLAGVVAHALLPVDWRSVLPGSRRPADV